MMKNYGLLYKDMTGLNSFWGLCVCVVTLYATSRQLAAFALVLYIVVLDLPCGVLRGPAYRQ